VGQSENYQGDAYPGNGLQVSIYEIDPSGSPPGGPSVNK